MLNIYLYDVPFIYSLEQTFFLPEVLTILAIPTSVKGISHVYHSRFLENAKTYKHIGYGHNIKC